MTPRDWAAAIGIVGFIVAVWAHGYFTGKAAALGETLRDFRNICGPDSLQEIERRAMERHEKANRR